MTFQVYLPQDRLHSLASNTTLPDRISGSALFADISGFTAFTEGLRNSLGPRRGAEELTQQIEVIFSALITQIELFGGSVIDFAGASILCWFDEDTSLAVKVESLDSDGQPSAVYHAVACGLALQHAMRPFAEMF